MPAQSARYAFLALPIATAILVAPARAETDAGQIAAGLAEAIEALATGSDVTYDGATAAADSVTITAFSVALADGTRATVPAAVLSGILPREAGGFTAVSLNLDDGTLTLGDRTMTWAAAAFADVLVPSEEEVKARPKIRPFRQLEMVEMNVSGESLASPVHIASARIEVAEISEELPTSVKASASGVQLPAALLGNSFLSILVSMLNYQEFTADVSVDGIYDPPENTAILQALTVDVATVGKVDIAAAASNFSINGVTDPDPEVAQAARSAARLDSARVRIENAGFVERMLAMQAEMLGGTPEDVRKQIVDGALPFALSFVKNEAFRNEFRAEVAEFLAEPRSLTIAFAPAEPLPLGQVTRAILRAPFTLPDLLAPTVTANEPLPPTPEEPQQ